MTGMQYWKGACGIRLWRDFYAGPYKAVIDQANAATGRNDACLDSCGQYVRLSAIIVGGNTPGVATWKQASSLAVPAEAAQNPAAWIERYKQSVAAACRQLASVG